MEETQAPPYTFLAAWVRKARARSCARGSRVHITSRRRVRPPDGSPSGVSPPSWICEHDRRTVYRTKAFHYLNGYLIIFSFSVFYIQKNLTLSELFTNISCFVTLTPLFVSSKRYNKNFCNSFTIQQLSECTCKLIVPIILPAIFSEAILLINSKVLWFTYLCLKKSNQPTVITEFFPQS